MLDESDAVRSLIIELEIPLVGSVIKDAREGYHYFAVVPVKKDNRGRQDPPPRRLERVRAELRARGYEVNFVLSDAQMADVEGGLRAALADVYRENVVSVAVALHARRAQVWVELTDAVSESLIESVRAKIKLYFELFDVEDLSIRIAVNDNLPSILACLRIVRQLAPVDLQTLRDRLQASQFSIPSDQWLSHRLDAMRRAGRVVRLKNGTYALTADTLSKLGTSRLRTSPDVTRMLALAQRSR